VGKQTTGIATINKTVLSQFKPIIPPVEIQQQYINIVNKIVLLKSQYSQNDFSLFESITQKAFTGEL